MGITVTTVENKMINMTDAMQLIVQLIIGALAYFSLAWGVKLEIMNDAIEMVQKKFIKKQ